MKPFTYYQRIFCFQFDSGYCLQSDFNPRKYIFKTLPYNFYININIKLFLLVGLIIFDQRMLKGCFLAKDIKVFFLEFTFPQTNIF